MKIEKIIDPPLWLVALSRAKNKANLGENKGDIWVCGLDSEQPWCKPALCADCKRKCYYMPDNADLVKKNAKKICPQCALEKLAEDLAADMKKLLKKIVEKSEDEQIGKK